MGVPAFLAAAAFGADIGQGVAQYNEYEEKVQQIDTQAKYTRLQYIQKSEANYDNIQKILATQTAQATVRGITLNSPSFNAIQRNTYNTFAKTQRNDDTYENISQLNDKIEKQQALDAFHSQIFGDIIDTGKQAASIIAAAPVGG